MDAPQRIVSLVPSHTESLHALGLADRVVGRTRFCIHPADWVETLPHVGGTKDASVEKILALKPDLVVADKDENPLATVKALQEAGVDVLWSGIDTVPDAASFLEILGTRCGVPDAGAEAAQTIWSALCDVAHDGDPIPVFCPIWYGPWMTFDRTAYPSAMLEAVGFRNAFADHEGPKYFEVAEGDVVECDTEYTLLPSEPFPFHQKRDTVDTSGLGPAGADGRVVEIDGEALTWFGVRTASGLRDLAAVRASLST